MTTTLMPEEVPGIGSGSALWGVHRTQQKRQPIEVTAVALPDHEKPGAEITNRSAPLWFDHLMSQIDRIRRLSPNWDSYGAPAISIDVVMALLKFMHEYIPDRKIHFELVPGSDGSVQFEWHPDRGDLEIAFHPEGKLSASYFDVSSGEELEMDQDDFDPGAFGAAIKRLLGAKALD